MHNDRKCIVCKEPLTGQQRFFCSGRCAKRGQRYPDKYPKPKPKRRPKPKPAPPTEVVDIPAAGSVGKLTAAVKAGKRDDILDALLQRLAMEIDISEDARTMAPLVARMLDVMDRITPGEESEKKGGLLDELTARRSRRTASR